MESHLIRNKHSSPNEYSKFKSLAPWAEQPASIAIALVVGCHGSTEQTSTIDIPHTHITHIYLVLTTVRREVFPNSPEIQIASDRKWKIPHGMTLIRNSQKRKMPLRRGCKKCEYMLLLCKFVCHFSFQRQWLPIDWNFHFHSECAMKSNGISIWNNRINCHRAQIIVWSNVKRSTQHENAMWNC